MASPHQILVTVLLLLFLRHADPQDNHVIVPGDVILAAMFSVNTVENDVCGAYDTETLQSIVAVSWFVEALNRMDYIPGVTLGLDVYRTCKMPEKATEGALRLMTKYGVIRDDSATDNNNNQSLLFGILGPERTSEALVVSRLVSSLPASQRVMQVTGSSTGQQLSDVTRYPNFFRVIPPDDTQVRVILELLLQLQWNYVAIVYEDDDYGRSAATELRQLAQGKQLCVPVFASLPIDIKSSKFAIKAREIANELKSPQNGLIRGVVILGGTSTTRDLLQTLSQIVSYVTLVLSEAVALQRSTLLTAAGQVSQLARGALVTTPRYLPLPEVREIWNRLWSNVTVFGSHARANPWLGQYFSRLAGCSYVTPGCWERASVLRTNQMAVDGRELSLYISYQVKAVAVMAALAKRVHNSTCGGLGGRSTTLTPTPTPTLPPGGGLCPQFRQKVVTQRPEVLDLLRRTRLDLRAFSPLSPTLFSPPLTSVEFNATTGDLVPGGDEEEYTVHNFRQQGGVGGPFNFVQIGSWKENTLTINTSQAQFYDENQSPLTWPQLPPAQCPNNHDCVMCDYDVSQDVIFVEGDFYVVAMAPASEVGERNVLECGPVKSLLGADLAQALVFAVQQVNKKTGVFANILPGKRVGLVVVNSCGSSLLVRKRLMDLTTGGGLLLPGHRNSSDVLAGRTLGYVCCYFSSFTMAAAETLNELGQPFVQVSGASTSVTLSDTSRFPHFLRLPAPDGKQAQAILDIVQTLGANYIQVIYDGTTAYASGLFLELQSNLNNSINNNKYNICIAQSIVTKAYTDLSHYARIKNQLRKIPEARIVIVILHHLEIAKVLKAVLPDLDPQEFMFLATESWGRRQDFITGPDSIKLVGSLVLSQEIVIDPFFQQYFQNLRPEASSNPWLAYFWEARLGCYFSKSFRRRGRSGPCPDDFARSYRQDLRVPFYIQSLYALVLGFHQALAKVCGPKAQSVCPTLTSANLLEETLKVKLDLYGTGQADRVFDSRGDGLVGYKVLQIDLDQSAASASSDVTYSDVGSWTLNKLTLEMDRLTLSRKPGFVSLCSNHVQCGDCFPAKKLKITEVCEGGGGGVSVAAFSSVVVVLVVVIAVLVVVIVLMCRRHKATQGALQRSQKTSGQQVGHVKYYSYHTEASAPEADVYSSIDGPATRPAIPPPRPCQTTNRDSDNYLHAVACLRENDG